MLPARYHLGLLGDGEATENERQPRAAWRVEERQSERQSRVLSAMRGEDADRLDMPATGDEERPMSITRWEEPWGTPWRAERQLSLRTIEAAARRRQAAAVRRELRRLLGVLT